MPTQDTSDIRDKIIQTIEKRGPSLPIHIASATGQSMLFSSAFLSELLAEKRLKLSNMRVGSSPLYLIPGQEPQLENFSKHLGNKEREAHDLLRDKKFLLDSQLHPAIRVALRSIKDFAIPFQHNNQIYWRYFTVPIEEFNPNIFPSQKQQPPQPQNVQHRSQQDNQTQQPQNNQNQNQQPIQQQSENLNSQHQIKKEEQNTSTQNLQKKNDEVSFEKRAEIRDEIRVEAKKPSKPKKQAKKSSKQDDKFFNNVKDYLNTKNIEILDIEGISKGELTLRIKQNDKEKLLIAFNKKRISETEILKAFKKSQDSNLPYVIISKGDTPKKLSNLIDALQSLDSIGKIE